MLQLIFFPLRQIRRLGHRAWRVGYHFDAQVHLEPGEAHDFLALLHPLRINFRILGFGRIRINADLVAELTAANHCVYRRVIHFARDVPQRHFYRTHSTALSRVPTKLFDLSENSVEL